LARPEFGAVGNPPLVRESDAHDSIPFTRSIIQSLFKISLIRVARGCAAATWDCTHTLLIER